MKPSYKAPRLEEILPFDKRDNIRMDIPKAPRNLKAEFEKKLGNRRFDIALALYGKDTTSSVNPSAVEDEMISRIEPNEEELFA